MEYPPSGRTSARDSRQKSHLFSKAMSLSENTQGQKRIFQKSFLSLIPPKSENSRNFKDSDEGSKRKGPSTIVNNPDFELKPIACASTPVRIEESVHVSSQSGMTSNHAKNSSHLTKFNLGKENKNQKPLSKTPSRGRGRGLLKYKTQKMSQSESLLEKSWDLVGEPHFPTGTSNNLSSEGPEFAQNAKDLKRHGNIEDFEFEDAIEQNAATAELPDLIICQSESKSNFTGSHNYHSDVFVHETGRNHDLKYAPTSEQVNSAQKPHDLSSLGSDQQVHKMQPIASDDISANREMKETLSLRDHDLLQAMNLGSQEIKTVINHSRIASKNHSTQKSQKGAENKPVIKGIESKQKTERKLANTANTPKKKLEKVHHPISKSYSPYETKQSILFSKNSQKEDWDTELSINTSIKMPLAHDDGSARKIDNNRVVETQPLPLSEQDNVQQVLAVTQNFSGYNNCLQISDKKVKAANPFDRENSKQHTNREELCSSVNEKVAALYHTFQCEKNVRAIEVSEKCPANLKTPMNKSKLEYYKLGNADIAKIDFPNCGNLSEQTNFETMDATLMRGSMDSERCVKVKPMASVGKGEEPDQRHLSCTNNIHRLLKETDNESFSREPIRLTGKRCIKENLSESVDFASIKNEQDSAITSNNFGKDHLSKHVKHNPHQSSTTFGDCHEQLKDSSMTLTNVSAANNQTEKMEVNLAGDEDLCALKLGNVTISDKGLKNLDKTQLDCTKEDFICEKLAKAHSASTTSSALNRPKAESVGSSDICSKSSSEIVNSASDFSSEQDIGIDSQSESEFSSHLNTNQNASYGYCPHTMSETLPSCSLPQYFIQTAAHSFNSQDERDASECENGQFHSPVTSTSYLKKLWVPIEEFSEENINILDFLQLCSGEVKTYNHNMQFKDSGSLYAVISVDLQYCPPSSHLYNTSGSTFHSYCPTYASPEYIQVPSHPGWNFTKEWFAYQSEHRDISRTEGRAICTPEGFWVPPQQGVSCIPDYSRHPPPAFALNAGMRSCTNTPHREYTHLQERDLFHHGRQQSYDRASLKMNGSLVKPMNTCFEGGDHDLKAVSNKIYESCDGGYKAGKAYTSENRDSAIPNPTPRKRAQKSSRLDMGSVLMEENSFLTPPQHLAHSDWVKPIKKQRVNDLLEQISPHPGPTLEPSCFVPEPVHLRHNSDPATVIFSQKESNSFENASNKNPGMTDNLVANSAWTDSKVSKVPPTTLPIGSSRQTAKDIDTCCLQEKPLASSQKLCEPIGMSPYVPCSVPLGASSTNWREHCSPEGHSGADLSQWMKDGAHAKPIRRAGMSPKRRSGFMVEMRGNMMGDSRKNLFKSTRGVKGRRSDPGLPMPQMNVSETSVKRSQWLAAFRQRSLTYQHKFIDTHCHIDFLYQRLRVDHSTPFHDFQSNHQEYFPPNFEGCIAIFCNPRTFALPSPQNTTLKMLEKEDNVWVALGCHPKNAEEFEFRHLLGLKEALRAPNVVALGEIGLDYSGKFYQHADIQKKAFTEQLKLALEFQLPLVIHCRDADDDCLDILRAVVPKDHKIHLHCFSRGFAAAQEWLDAFPNMCLGLTPLISYSSAVEAIDTATHIPLDRLLLETDAPYFVPGSLKKTDVSLSYPGLALTTAETVASHKGITVDQVLEACRKNTEKIYGI
ncbi:3'-5' ssDNA/RNA exonuclease tatd [Plakobranchus ocellatus]|uniref:3'-5' ssDNA/RNA exonuclease tatd n=1 Tax=Plakobranchus ocellatus TaxID=259542 RepID=A0AAV4B9C3_9GAST|nr:3'-5' ssDNA/RNA exonuclease tatd [Plakobranchus ocellatus]